MLNTKQVQGGIQVIAAVAEAIRALGSVPSGHLYAQLMGSMDLEQYNAVIRTLKNAKLVTEKNYMLTWVGPQF